ncbi:MAG: hypothetical protein AMXMBFR4_10400 [Candidatus Hydrogenedentota bacterium]
MVSPVSLRRVSVFVIVPVILCATGFAQDAPPAAGPPVVARIGDSEVITKKEFDRAVTAIEQIRMAQIRARGGAPDGVSARLSHDGRLRLLDNLVDERVLFMLARQAGVTVSDDEVTRDIDERKNGLPANMSFEEFLRQQGMTPEEVQDLTRRRLITQRFREQHTRDITVTPQEIDKQYNELKLRGALDTADVQHIFVMNPGTDAAAVEAGRQSIEAAYKRLKAGEDFAVVAKEVSQDSESKDNGGAYAGVRHGRFVPELDRRIFELPVGELSEPFRSRTGWHLVKVRSRGVASLDEKMSEDIRKSLFEMKSRQIISKLVQEARSKLNIQINLPAEAPESLPAPSPSTSILDSAT